jgi:hypothetical protein
MSNLVQCRRCKQDLIREEFENHVCNRHFKGVKNIEVLQWWETINENGERVAFGMGSDGYTYKLTEVKEGFVEFDPQTPKLNTEKKFDETPTGEQNLMETSVNLSRFVIIKLSVLRFGVLMQWWNEPV